MPARVPIALACALALAPATSAHDASVSRSRLSVEGARATLDLRFQTLSLIESLPELDRDGDGRFTAEELEAASAAVETYLLARWQLLPPPFDGSGAGGAALSGRLESLRFATDIGDLDQQYQWVDGRFEFAAPGATGGGAAGFPEELVVHSELFTERDPYHRDFLLFTYEDEPTWEVLFGPGEHRWRFRAARLRRGEVRARFFEAELAKGVRRFELFAFLLGVVVAAGTSRGVLVPLGLFLASAALAVLWALGGLPLPPARFLALALPLAAAYVGAESLLRRVPRTASVESLLFGALFGLTLQRSQRELLVLEPLVGEAWVGVGGAALVVVIGVVVGVVGLVVLARLVSGAGDVRAGESVGVGVGGLAPRWLLLLGSVLVLVVGLGGFLVRAGWV